MFNGLNEIFAKFINFIFLIFIISLQLSEFAIAQPIHEDRIWRDQLSPDTFLWNYGNFSGFYYNINNNFGTESMRVHITRLEDDKKVIAAGDFNYLTKYKEIDFSFDQWGKYNSICFLGKKYFVGYSSNSEIPSNDVSLIGDGNLFKILIDENVNYPLGANSVLALEEGYEIDILDVNSSRKTAVLYLRKNGDLINRRIMSLDESIGSTFIFNKYINKEEIPLIILHLTMPFSGNEFSSITVDGIFQISENPVSLKDDFVIHDMYIIDSHSRIELRNNKSITLKKDSIIPLFGNIGFKVADSVELRFMPIQLRFENYRSASISPDEFEIYTLTPSNFDGFYYDIDNDLGTEQLILTATYGNTFYEPEGVIYSTTAQKERFRFSDWGYFKVIGFLGEKYFAGYVLDENIPPDYQIQYAKSIDKDSLYNGQLQRILMDDDREITIVSGTPLKLGEGYELSIKSIDINGNMVYLELYKDGALVETKAISPYMDNPTMSDRTYYYKKDVGDQKELVIISVCFKNAFRGVDANVATIEGIWQISEDITKVTTGTEYVKMRIASVTANTITMDNKDNSIKLGKNKKIDLMGDISIETADDDDTRYLIKKSSTNIGLSDSLVS